MARSVKVNAGNDENDALEPQGFDDDPGELAAEAETAPPEPLGWVDAPRPPDMGPPRVPRLPRQIGAAGCGPAGPLSTPAGEPGQGPCLYFGPAGQRCERRALPGGFCSRHQPASQLRPSAPLSAQQISKRALGVAGILAVLWPILFDVIREIVRLLR